MLVCVMPFCLAPCPPVRIDISILESRMYYWHDVDGPATVSGLLRIIRSRWAGGPRVIVVCEL